MWSLFLTQQNNRVELICPCVYLVTGVGLMNSSAEGQREQVLTDLRFHRLLRFRCVMIHFHISRFCSCLEERKVETGRDGKVENNRQERESSRRDRRMKWSVGACSKGLMQDSNTWRIKVVVQTKRWRTKQIRERKHAITHPVPVWWLW